MSRPKKKIGRPNSSTKTKIEDDEPSDVEIKRMNKQSQKLLSRWEQDIADIRKSLYEDEDDY